MGKSWDSFVPGPSLWREMYKALKPGGYLIAFFGPRTYDLGCMAIRLAGFEVRDMVSWIYGSGFPKSLDISKAIDAHLGAERLVTGKDPNARPIDGRGSGYTNATTHNPNIFAPGSPEAAAWEG